MFLKVLKVLIVMGIIPRTKTT